MHEPVLLKEVIELLRIKKEGRYVDGTLGLGGHAEAILKELEPHGRLLGLDVDSESLVRAENRLQPFGNRSNTRRSNFRGLQGILRDLGWGEADGLLFDLGVSSFQIDRGERGFSFQKEGPLDMRLDPGSSETAMSVLRTISPDEFESLLREFGEARFARKLAGRILDSLSQEKLKTTLDLARICGQVAGGRGKVHPATRVFLALRAKVNDEIGSLEALLNQIPECLTTGGRAAIISFHSIEDRLVKHSFSRLEKEGYEEKKFVRVTRKPVVPSPEELRANPRSRSAKLRVLERTE